MEKNYFKSLIGISDIDWLYIFALNDPTVAGKSDTLALYLASKEKWESIKDIIFREYDKIKIGMEKRQKAKVKLKTIQYFYQKRFAIIKFPTHTIASLIHSYLLGVAVIGFEAKFGRCSGDIEKFVVNELNNTNQLLGQRDINMTTVLDHLLNGNGHLICKLDDKAISIEEFFRQVGNVTYGKKIIIVMGNQFTCYW